MNNILIMSILVLMGVMFFVPVFADEDSIPTWIKTVFGLYSKDQITDAELISALEFLISNDIIKISQQEDKPNNDYPIVKVDVIRCDIISDKYIEIKASLTNNDSISHDFHMVLYGQDTNGNMLTFTEHSERNVLAGHTVYFDRFIDNISEIDNCGIKFE